jgi:hypothetical protein
MSFESEWENFEPQIDSADADWILSSFVNSEDDEKNNGKIDQLVAQMWEHQNLLVVPQFIPGTPTSLQYSVINNDATQNFQTNQNQQQQQQGQHLLLQQIQSQQQPLLLQQQQLQEQLSNQKFVPVNSPESHQRSPYNETPPQSPFVLKGLPQKQFSLSLHEAEPEPSATKYISQINENLQQQKQKLELMKQQQRGVLNQSTPQAFVALETEQKLLKNQIDEQLKALQQIYCKFLLSPQDLHSVYQLHSELQLQLKQLELLYVELQLLVNPSHIPCFAALAIVRQPFPDVYSKGKQLSSDSLVVQLLTGTAINIKSFSNVRAVISHDNFQLMKSEKRGQRPLESDEQPLDLTTRTASFPLKFHQGSRKTPVALKFGVQVEIVGRNGNVLTATIESPWSEPFIVMTNECQWEECEEILLRKDIFGNRLEVPWLQFCNTLQRHFLRATRQDPLRPQRALSRYDFAYIQNKFFEGRSNISQKDFDGFWSWFGKSLHVLRYQRHINTLWQQGLIYGFMTREEVNAALSGQEPGTFVIRFSERYAGQFGIAYVGSTHKVKHYLVGPNDTAGAKKTLADFLSGCSQFAYILQLTFDLNGKPIFKKYPKDQCFSQFYSLNLPTSTKPEDDGYDPLENQS